MYKNYLIVASKLDKAGINITTQLSQFGNMNFYLVENEIIFTENLDMEKINKYDFIIFASRHVSEKGEKTLSVHAPGNWNQAKFGGKEGKVCKTSAFFQKQLFEKLKKNIEKFDLRKYDLTMECTHHGPLINKPCVFVEIGATETEWKDRKAGFVVAKAILETMQEFKQDPYNEVAIGIGGPHYCPGFNKIQMNSNVAISHVIPEYALPLTEEMVQEAIAGTEEDIDMILLDWKGLGNSEKRQQVMDIVNKFYIQKRKTSEIPK
ncbi:MAG: D-aminoacyl-tRNA deacylase [Candidatus Pacearchaeota archaeon]|nr:D-aminoacyl-tRNA deacylase [Candidatus Pacearchaeota archaeon]